VRDGKEAEHYSMSKNLNCCARMFGGCGCCCCSFNIPRGYGISGKGKGELQHLTTPGRQEDVYKLVFPTGASEEERVLLLAGAFLVDYALHDNKPAPSTAPHGQQMK